MNGTGLGSFESRLLETLTQIDAQRAPATADAGHKPGPGRRQWPRPAVLAGLTVAVVAAGGATAVATVLLGQPGFQAAGEVVVAGDPVTVKGSGCSPRATVTMRLDSVTDLGATVATADGLFTAMPVIPTDTKPGRHTLTARCARADRHQLVQRLTLTVINHRPALAATLAVAGEATPGGPLLVKGAGCRPGAAVRLTLDGAGPLATAVAGAQGQFDALGALPDGTSVGVHEVVASCAGPRGAVVLKATFMVVRAQPTAADTTKPTAAVTKRPHG